MLIHVATEWKDQRLVPSLLSKLEQITATPDVTAASLALALGEVLDDEHITETARLLQDAAYKASRSAAPDDETEGGGSDEPEDAEPASAAGNQSPSELLRQFIVQVKAKIEPDKVTPNVTIPPSGR
jgi:hypothetical protein